MIAHFFLLLALVQVNFGYIHTGNYVAFGEMRPDYAYVLAENEENNNRGTFWLFYDGGSKVLTYYIGATYFEYTTVGIYGPSRCDENMNNPDCVYRTGELLHQLTSEGTGLLTGSVTLSCEQESMLFLQELYIRFDIESKPEGALRSHITMTSLNSATMVLSTIFGPNYGDFNDDTSSDSTSSGFGAFTWNTGTNSINYRIYHSAEDVSSFVLECPTLTNRNKQMAGETESAVFSATTNFDDEPDMLLEMLSGNCYFFMVSRAFVNGELFGRVTPYGQSYSLLTGANQVPAVVSSYYAQAVFMYDFGAKSLYTIVAHNVTDEDFTAVNVKMGSSGQTGETVCTSTTANFNCRLNSTTFPMIETGELYIEVETVTAAGGEIRGQIQDSPGGTSGGLSQGGIIALAVVGSVVGVALIGGLGFLVYKNSSGCGSKKI